MKRITAIVLALSILSCSQPKVDRKAEEEKVMQTSKDWAQTTSTGDVEKTLSYWTDDAVVMSAGRPTLKGKEAIRQMVTESFKIPGFRINWQPQSAQLSEGGDMAYLIENSQVSFTDSTGKPITLNNKAVTIWRKQTDGTWKDVMDISTPESPESK